MLITGRRHTRRASSRAHGTRCQQSGTSDSTSSRPGRMRSSAPHRRRFNVVQVCLLSLSSVTGPAGYCVCAFLRLFNHYRRANGASRGMATTDHRGDWRGNAGAAVPARCLSAYGTEMPLRGLRKALPCPAPASITGCGVVVSLSGCTVSDRQRSFFASLACSPRRPAAVWQTRH